MTFVLFPTKISNKIYTIIPNYRTKCSLNWAHQKSQIFSEPFSKEHLNIFKFGNHFVFDIYPSDSTNLVVPRALEISDSIDKIRAMFDWSFKFIHHNWVNTSLCTKWTLYKCSKSFFQLTWKNNCIFQEIISRKTQLYFM